MMKNDQLINIDNQKKNNSSKKWLIKISSNIFYLLPLSLLTGPFLPDLFISIIAVLIIAQIIVDKNFNYFTNNFFYLFILFYIYINFSSLFSSQIIHSLESSVFYFRFGLFAISTWYLIDNNKQFLKNFTIMLIFTFILALFGGYFQFFAGFNPFGFRAIDNLPRLTLTFHDKLLLGSYIARLFPLLLALIIYHFAEKKIGIFLIVIFLILSDVLTFISGERTAFALIFMSTILVIFLIQQYRMIRIFTFIFSILIITIIAFTSEKIMQRNIEHTMNQIGVTNGKINAFSPQHTEHFISAFKMFIDRPILGHGPNSFRLICNNEEYVSKYSCSTHPHNTIFQLLSETGIIGTFYFFCFSLFFIYKLIKDKFFRNKKNYSKLNDYQICLFICVLLTLVPFTPTQNFFNNWINVVYYLPAGFIIHSFNSVRNK